MTESSEVCKFADDNTICAFDDSIECILRLLKGDFTKLTLSIVFNNNTNNNNFFKLSYAYIYYLQ